MTLIEAYNSMLEMKIKDLPFICLSFPCGKTLFPVSYEGRIQLLDEQNCEGRYFSITADHLISDEWEIVKNES